MAIRIRTQRTDRDRLKLKRTIERMICGKDLKFPWMWADTLMGVLDHHQFVDDLYAVGVMSMPIRTNYREWGFHIFSTTERPANLVWVKYFAWGIIVLDVVTESDDLVVFSVCTFDGQRIPVNNLKFRLPGNTYLRNKRNEQHRSNVPSDHSDFPGRPVDFHVYPRGRRNAPVRQYGGLRCQKE